MKEGLNKNSAGLSLGIIFLAVHIIWFIAVGLGFGKEFLSWIIGTHFITLNIQITEFGIISAVFTLVRAFIAGYIIGWLFVFIYNKINGGKK